MLTHWRAPGGLAGGLHGRQEQGDQHGDSPTDSRSPGFLRGHVVDWIAVGWFPVFNVADSCITIGAVVLVVRTLLAPAPAATRAP